MNTGKKKERGMAWKPKAWVAVVLGFVFPPFAFLYVNRTRLALLSLVAFVCVSVADIRFETFFGIALCLASAVYACRIARRFGAPIVQPWYSTGWGMAGMVSPVILSVILVRIFVVEPFFVPSSSMSPAIRKDSYVAVSKLGFGLRVAYGITLGSTKSVAPELMERGEVYLFHPPSSDEPYMKRLMALPGDTIVFTDEGVSINGKALPRWPLYDFGRARVYEERLGGISYRVTSGAVPVAGAGKYVVPDDSYFFVGDWRDRSIDSRYWGAVSGDRIIGKVVHTFQ